MHNELMNLGLSSKEAENFSYYVSKMVGNISLGIEAVWLEDAALEELLYTIYNYGK